MTNGVACHSDGGGDDNSICQILQMRMRTSSVRMRVILRMRMRKMRKMMKMRRIRRMRTMRRMRLADRLAR